jgi:hypothetical protein
MGLGFCGIDSSLNTEIAQKIFRHDVEPLRNSFLSGQNSTINLAVRSPHRQSAFNTNFFIGIKPFPRRPR